MYDFRFKQWFYVFNVPNKCFYRLVDTNIDYLPWLSCSALVLGTSKLVYYLQPHRCVCVQIADIFTVHQTNVCLLLVPCKRGADISAASYFLTCFHKFNIHVYILQDIFCLLLFPKGFSKKGSHIYSESIFTPNKTNFN